MLWTFLTNEQDKEKIRNNFIFMFPIKKANYFSRAVQPYQRQPLSYPTDNV